jgi:hypothetical protein
MYRPYAFTWLLDCALGEMEKEVAGRWLQPHFECKEDNSLGLKLCRNSHTAQSVTQLVDSAIPVRSLLGVARSRNFDCR